MKPDLAHFYDMIYTTDTDLLNPSNYPAYTSSFRGTSAATPIAAGMFGLFFQMWHEGLFHVCDQNGCQWSGGECTVFDSRPHSMTAKVMVINSASAYSLTPDLARNHQGWGLPDIGRMHLLRNNFPVIVDETRTLEANDVEIYTVTVPALAYALRATLAYRDPPSSCSGGAPCRKNDLTLRVDAPFNPGQTRCYLGNHGLLNGDWSTLITNANDCSPTSPPHADTINTVENVFVQEPSAGQWTIRIRAVLVDTLAQYDGHVVYVNGDPSECISDSQNCIVTSPQDVAFALVISLDMDCNQNGRSDADDILDSDPQTSSEDCNTNSIPDECKTQPVECGDRGACCEVNDGCGCRIMSESECISSEGFYAGDETLCSELTCLIIPPP